MNYSKHIYSAVATGIVGFVLVCEPFLNLEKKLLNNEPAFEAVTPDVKNFPHTHPEQPVDNTEIFNQITADSTASASGVFSTDSFIYKNIQVRF